MNKNVIGAMGVAFFAIAFYSTPVAAQENQNPVQQAVDVQQSDAPPPALADEQPQIDSRAEERDVKLAKEALALYDSMEAHDPFSPRYNKRRLTDQDFTPRPNSSFSSNKFSAQPRFERPLPLADEPWDRNRSTQDRFMQDRTKQDRVIEVRQRAADRVADMISPGFGRKEFKMGGHAHGRLDYIYAGKCRVKGLGMCVQISFY